MYFYANLMVLHTLWVMQFCVAFVWSCDKILKNLSLFIFGTRVIEKAHDCGCFRMY